MNNVSRRPTPALPPLALYVHIPWCVRKCPYCDFNSHARDAATVPEQAYVDALLRDLHTELAYIGSRPVVSIFFGGGTPSLFSADAIERFLSGAAGELNFASDVEITMEANPGTAEARRFADYRRAGINRLSLGVQSLNDASLKRLGRIHDAAGAVRAVELARRAGFDDFNLDFMYGLPDQQPDAALADLEQGLALGPSHLSWYQLTIEPNTLFHHHPPDLPEENLIWEMAERGRALLECSGFHRYEISAYARDGRRCRHNLNYWLFGDYLGIGAGAHGKISNPGRNSIVRHARHRLPDRYMTLAGTPAARVGSRELNDHDRVFEFMLNACRLVDGFPQALFGERTGLGPELLEPGLATARARGLLRLDGAMLQPTGAGLQFLNDLLQMFLPPEASEAAVRRGPEAA